MIFKSPAIFCRAFCYLQMLVIRWYNKLKPDLWFIDVDIIDSANIFSRIFYLILNKYSMGSHITRCVNDVLYKIF
jgi:hypothetical protein